MTPLGWLGRKTSTQTNKAWSLRLQFTKYQQRYAPMKFFNFIFFCNSTYSLYPEHWIIQEPVFVLHLFTCHGRIMPRLAELLYMNCRLSETLLGGPWLYAINLWIVSLGRSSLEVRLLYVFKWYMNCLFRETLLGGRALYICLCIWIVSLGRPSLEVQFFISSLEHEVLKVSYCDWSVSIIPRLTSFVPHAASTICLKSLLLLHPWASWSKLGRKHQGDF